MTPATGTRIGRCGVRGTTRGKRRAGTLVPVFDAARCKGCALCVAACPKGALEIVGGEPTVRADACTGCRECELLCPDFAIEMIERRRPDDPDGGTAE